MGYLLINNSWPTSNKGDTVFNSNAFNFIFVMFERSELWIAFSLGTFGIFTHCTCKRNLESLHCRCFCFDWPSNFKRAIGRKCCAIYNESHILSKAFYFLSQKTLRIASKQTQLLIVIIWWRKYDSGRLKKNSIRATFVFFVIYLIY